MMICPMQVPQSYADPVHRLSDVSSDCPCIFCIAHHEISAPLQADHIAAFFGVRVSMLYVLTTAVGFLVAEPQYQAAHISPIRLWL